MRIAITGSSGFIGNELVQHFLTNGHEVFLLQRKQPKNDLPGAHFIPYDLNNPPALSMLPPLDALIHAAYMPYHKGNDSSIKNVEGSMTLYRHCLENNIQFVFLSSFSAHIQSLSEYGKHKFELEKRLDHSKCLILKLGLVIGKRGLFSRMEQSLKKSPFIFLIGGGRQPVQPIVVQDVVKVIAQSLEIKRKGQFLLATEKVYTIKELLMKIAQNFNRHTIFIPVPFWMAEIGIKGIKILQLPFPVSMENLLGLKQLRAYDTKADMEKLQVHFSDF